jgi:hypothetical protein
MLSPLDNAVAHLLATHAAHQAQREATTTEAYILRGDVANATPEMKAQLTEAGFGKVFAPKAEKKAPIHKTEKAAVVKQDTSKLKTSHGEAYDPPGTLDAAGFFSAIKRAGKRVNEHGVLTFVGKTLNGEDVVAKDKRAAIAAYIGYNAFELLGEQEQRATQQANRELGITKLAGQLPKEVYRELRTVQGVTFGLPDHTSKRLADLKAQRKELVDGIIVAEGKVSEVLSLRNRAKREGNLEIMAEAQALLDLREGEMLVQRALLDACEQAISDLR